LARQASTDLNVDSPFFDSSRVQQTKVAWELAILSKAMDHCPMAAAISNFEDISAYSRRTSWNQIPLPEVLAHYITLIGNIVVEGEFITFAPDFRPRVSQIFNGVTPAYQTSTVAAGNPIYVASGALPSPGVNIPEHTSRWFVDSIYPGVYSKVGAWASSSFAHPVLDQFAGIWVNGRYNSILQDKTQTLNTSDLGLVVTGPGPYTAQTRMPLLTPFNFQASYQNQVQAYSNLSKGFCKAIDLDVGGLLQTSQSILLFMNSITLSVATLPPLSPTNVNYIFSGTPTVNCAGFDYALSRVERGATLTFGHRTYQGIQFLGSLTDTTNAALFFASYYSKNGSTNAIRNLVLETITSTESDTAYSKEREAHYMNAIKQGLNNDAASLFASWSCLNRQMSEIVVDRQAGVPATKYALEKTTKTLAYPFYCANVYKDPSEPGGFNFFTWLQGAAATVARAASAALPYIQKGIQVVEFVAPFFLKGDDMSIRNIAIKKKIMIAHRFGDEEFEYGGWVSIENTWKFKTKEQLESALGITSYKDKKKELLTLDF